MMKPDILYEDQHLLVALKPSGVPTQTRQIATPDMVSLLKKYLAANAQLKGEPYLAVIHRLDQPVSGLLVFAKTPTAAKSLNHQLQTSGFGKYYLALLCGQPPSSEGTLTDYLIKDARGNRSSVDSAQNPLAKKAILHYSHSDQAALGQDDITEVQIRLETGRHHQIRVQMAHLGCPLLGDTKYNHEPYPDGQQCPLALCAYRLAFSHPKSNQRMEFLTKPFWSDKAPFK